MLLTLSDLCLSDCFAAADSDMLLISAARPALGRIGALRWEAAALDSSSALSCEAALDSTSDPRGGVRSLRSGSAKLLSSGLKAMKGLVQL